MVAVPLGILKKKIINFFFNFRCRKMISRLCTIGVLLVLQEVTLFAEQERPSESGCIPEVYWSDRLNQTLNSTTCSLLTGDTFPPITGNMTEQLNLIIAVKQLKSFSFKYFADMTNVRVLNVSHNNIYDFEDLGVFGSTLVMLDIGSNQLTKVDLRYFRGLNELEFLYLMDNNIHVIEQSSWLDLRKLSILDLSKNRLSEITKSDFTGLGNLASLMLSSNTISHIEPGAFLGLNKLNFLDLTGNHLYKLNADSLRGLEQVTTFLVAANRFKRIPNDAFRVFRKLSVLDVGRNQIHVLERDSFLSINVTKIRYCGDSRTTFIEEGAFRDCHELREVEICNNKKLRYIDVGAFGNSPSLKVADFSYNNLSIVPDISTINTTVLYDVRGNNIKCVCPNLWLFNTSDKVKGISKNMCKKLSSRQKNRWNKSCPPFLIHELKAHYHMYFGGRAKLYCFAHGNPIPDVTWLKLSSNISGNSTYNTFAEGTTLILEPISDPDSGHYACYAKNNAGSARFDFVLHATDRNLTLVVLAVSSSSATVTWTEMRTPPLSFLLSWTNIQFNDTELSPVLHPFPLWKSYRISGLNSSSEYVLCLQIVNASHTHSCVSIKTKANEATFGIFNAKNLVLGIAAAGSIFFILVISCISCFIERYNKKEKFGCVVPHSTSQDVFLDEISDTMPITYENQMAELYGEDIEQPETLPNSLM